MVAVNSNTSPTFIGNINPFRYRGYYYDSETGFYYLQTRYYDPTICRFINADNYELVSQLASSKELNMYAYCRNNPIMYTDETGEFAWIIALAVIGVGAIVGGIVGGVRLTILLIDGSNRYIEKENVKIRVNENGRIQEYALCKLDYIEIGR